MNDRGHWPTGIRLTAVGIWSSFIGAVMTMTLLLMLAPSLEQGRFSWPLLSGWFVMSWLASFVPVVFALALAAPPMSERVK